MRGVGEGGGGGQKTKWKTPSPNFEELIENITNIFSGESRERSYGKVRGGGEVLAKKEFLKKNSSLFLNFFFALQLALQQHNDGIILFVVFTGVQFVQR